MAQMTAIECGYRIEHEGRWCEVVMIQREVPKDGLLVVDPEMKRQFSVAIRSSHGMNDLYVQWSDDEFDTLAIVRNHACECLSMTASNIPDSDFGLLAR